MKNLDWARECAAAYDANPTPARAHNAAQHLTAALAQIDLLTAAVAELAAHRNHKTLSPAYYLTELGERAIAPKAQGKGAARAGKRSHQQPNGLAGGGDPHPGS